MHLPTQERAAQRALAAELKRIRKAAMLTQSQLAHRLDTKQSAIARIEKGEGWPRFRVLFRWAWA